MTAKEKSNNFPTHYVGIGASAGGLEAIEQFFQNIPGNTGLAFIVIQHLSPDYKSMMVELLSKKTEMAVLRAEEGMVVEKNSIYLIPPKKNLTIFHGKLLLSDQPPHDRWINLPIDIFFRSLSEDQGEKAVGIILSGTGSDGSRGVRAIKELGGLIMVQDEKDAKFDGMPKSATSTGVADFIIPAAEMPEKLLRYVKNPYLTKSKAGEELISSDEGLTAIYAMLRSKTKVDFTYYKPNTVIRRIERRMTVNQLDDLQSYIKLLQTHQRELTTLYRELLIGVTSFFRDKEAFDHLSETILPELFKNKKDGPMRFWVTGCSTGEEAYSLALISQEIMEQNGIENDIKIFATDVDNDAIIVAGNGIYPESIAADVGSHLLAKYFQRQGDNYAISRKIREKVVFAQHNIINDPPFTNIDFISCRNLLIYLQPVLQKKAFEMFNFSLSPQGFLFLGKSESTGEMSSYFKARHHKWKIYQSKGKRGNLDERVTNSFNYSPKESLKTNPVARNQPGRTYNENERHVGERLLKTLAGDTIPLTVVVNEDMEVVYTIGDTRAYFRLPDGKMENDIRKMLQKELSIPLSIGIQKVFKDEKEITYNNIHFQADGIDKILHIKIKPLVSSKIQQFLIALIFNEVNDSKQDDKQTKNETFDHHKEAEQRILDLEQELQYSKENLQATIEELETSNEELQATNEELLASNEELQSTNEELQSVNEELYTVNSEHQRKIMELIELNNDIDNLLTNTEIGTIFLDEQMKVRKFTPSVQEVFNVIKSDIGRFFGDLTHKLKNVDILDRVKRVMATSEIIDKKVQSKSGTWFFMRIIPYNIAPSTFAGVIITLVEISDMIIMENALEDSEARLDLVEEFSRVASWQWNIETGTFEFSSNLEKLLGYKQGRLGNTYDSYLSSLHQEDRQRVIDLVTSAVENGNDCEITHRITWPDGTVRTVKQVGVASIGPNGKANKMTGITIDVTDEQNGSLGTGKDGDNKKAGSTKMTDGLVVINEQGIIESINTTVEEMFGYTADEMVGNNISILMPEPHRTSHDNYLQKYLETGEAKIIGIGRKIKAMHKDGSLIDLNLSVGEIKIGKQSLFSGILRRNK